MALGSDNPFPSILLEEHVDPTTPPSGHWRLFMDTDNIFKKIDDAGTVTSLEAAGFSDPMTTRGDVIVRNASNVTARLAKGSAGTYLGSDGTDVGYAAVTDAQLSTSDITTNNASTTKHGFAPKYPNDATKYLDGTGAYTVPAGGGGGLTQSYVGYNTVGASSAAFAGNTMYLKTITLGANSQLLSIDTYVEANQDAFAGAGAVVLTDVAGAPTLLIGAATTPAMLLSNSTSGYPDPARWLSIPMGIYLTAGTYWIGFFSSGAIWNYYYDTGTDRTQQGTAGYISGAHAALTMTTTARKFSIRGNILS